MIYTFLVATGATLILSMVGGRFERSIPLVAAIVALVGVVIFIHIRYWKEWYADTGRSGG